MMAVTLSFMTLFLVVPSFNSVPLNSGPLNASSIEMPSIQSNESVGSSIFRHREVTQKRVDPSGIQYSPLDLAVYVYNTGDEEGVAVAVEELVREGLVGRTDAINYLQEVKQLLAFMRDETKGRKDKKQPDDSIFPPEKSATSDPTHQVSLQAKTLKAFTLKLVYEMSKDIFTLSIVKNNPQVDEPMTKFISFLEREVQNKQIPTDVKETILEAVSAGLVDSLREGLQSQNVDEAGADKLIKVAKMYRNMEDKGPDKVLELANNISKMNSRVL